MLCKIRALRQRYNGRWHTKSGLAALGHKFDADSESEVRFLITWKPTLLTQQLSSCFFPTVSQLLRSYDTATAWIEFHLLFNYLNLRTVSQLLRLFSHLLNFKISSAFLRLLWSSLKVVDCSSWNAVEGLFQLLSNWKGTTIHLLSRLLEYCGLCNLRILVRSSGVRSEIYSIFQRSWHGLQNLEIVRENMTIEGL